VKYLLRSCSSNFLAVLVVFLLLNGCSPSADDKDSSASKKIKEPTQTITAEKEAYYRSKYALPPAVFEALESGKITQEEVDDAPRRRVPSLFPLCRDQGPAQDLSGSLTALSKRSATRAVKGGTLYARLQDFRAPCAWLGPIPTALFGLFCSTMSWWGWPIAIQ